MNENPIPAQTIAPETVNELTELKSKIKDLEASVEEYRAWWLKSNAKVTAALALIRAQSDFINTL